MRMVSRPSSPGIITSISTRSMSRSRFSVSMPSLPLSACSTFMPWVSSALVIANTLRMSSSTTSTLRPGERLARLRAAAPRLSLRTGPDGNSARHRVHLRPASHVSGQARRLAGGLVVERQVEGEGAALARHARHADLAAEQARELAADRQAEAGAAVLAAGRAVGLLERLEDQALLVGRDADAGVDHREGDRRIGAVEHRVAHAPARGGGLDAQAHLALAGELERVRQQVGEDLLQALAVGLHRRRQLRARAATTNSSPLSSAIWRKVRSTESTTSSKRSTAMLSVTVPDSIFARSRMSLIRASSSAPEEWMVRANSTCFGVRLPPTLSASRRARISRLLSGVRSSCDMLARNSDL